MTREGLGEEQINERTPEEKLDALLSDLAELSDELPLITSYRGCSVAATESALAFMGRDALETLEAHGFVTVPEGGDITDFMATDLAVSALGLRTPEAQA